MVIMTEQTEHASDPPSEASGEPEAIPHALGSPNPVLALIERVALDPRADVEKLERMLALQERIMAKESEREFNAAKARVSKRLASLRIVKSKSVLYDIDKNNKAKGQQEAFKYAPLEDIDKIVRPLLIENDLDVSYTTRPRENGAVVVGRLAHTNGHFQEAEIPVPLDSTGGKTNAQAMGSTFSYGRRYTLCMLLNIVVVGEDDDGAGGLITEEQVKHLLSLVPKAKAGPRWLKYSGAMTLEQAGSLEAAIATIPAKKHAQALVALNDLIEKRNADPS
jgi:hypothetical protein